MAINKNFVIKNGVEVNTSLIVGDATLNKVGVGTTVPGYTLHVGGSRGGIGATDLTVTGIATVGTSGSTSAALSVVGVSSFQGDIHLLGSAGVSTISFDASLDKLNFADNARATFGADDDLQILHDGSQSIIRETGTGNLVIEGTGETLASFIDDGAVELYHDNTKRLETTGFGVTIFDTLHSKQVNVSGASTFTGITTFNGADVFVDNSLFVGGVNINGGSGGALGIDLRTRNINASGIATITGQLGIGSIAAGAGLTVFGDVDITGLTTTNTLQVGNLGLNVTGVSTFSDDLAVGVSTLFADVSTGFVGVGTAVPGFPLEVRVDSVKRLQVDATGASVTGVVTGTSGGSFAQIKVGQSDINTITGEGGTLNLDAGDGTGGIVNVNSDVNLRLNHGLDVATGVSTFKNDLNVGLTTFFVDKSTGRIGIGTNVPSAALEVGATAGTGIGVSIHENGNAGFTGIVTVGGTLEATSAVVGSAVTINNTGINITGVATVNSVEITGGGAVIGLDITTRNLNVSGVSTFANDLAVGVSTLFADVSEGRIGIGTDVPASTLDVAGGLTANSAKIEDLTENRVVIAGTDGELEDDSNFTFDGAMLKVGTAATIAVNGNAAFAGIVTVGGDLNVIGDIVYDEVTGRNLNITGFSTFADDVNIGVSTFFADVSAGRVGIGTDIPANILHLSSTGTPTIQITDEDNSGIVKIENGSGSLFLNADTGNTVGNSRIQFGIDGSEKLRIDSSGRVGIGTDDPGAQSSSANNLVVADFAGEGGITIKNGSDSSGNIFFADEAGAAQGRIQYNHVNNYLRFHTDGDNERLRIDSSGRIGIGTNNPAEELHLNFAEPTIRLEDSDNNRYAQINAANGNLRFDADQGNEQANTEIAFRIDGSNVLTITDAADIGVVLGGGATVGSSSGIVTFIGDGSQLTGVISGIDITEDAGLVGAAITNLKFTGSGISTVTTDTSVGIATISISGGGGGVSETDTSVSTTTATGVGSFAVATHRSASIIAQIDQGANYQVGRYLMIHDGTTATVIEESAIATGDMLGSFSADINNSNAELKVTMNSSGIATVTTKIDSVTV